MFSIFFSIIGWSVSSIDSFSVCRYARAVRAKMTVTKLRGTMHRARMEAFPNIPHTLRGLTQAMLTDPNLAQTTDETEHMYAGSTTATDGSHHVMFISPRMAEFMGNCKYIHGDGTFKSRPALPRSSQCFVLVTSWRHCVRRLNLYLKPHITIMQIISSNFSF